MLEQIGNAITFYAMFIASKVGKTGLTVTVDVYNPAGALVVTAGSATAIGGGLYKYQLASGSVTTAGEYLAIFKTADSTVDAQHIPALWAVGKPWVERVDATVDSRLAYADWLNEYVAPENAAILTTAATVATNLNDKITSIDAALSATHGAGSWESSGSTAAEVWGYTTRTLTQSAAQVADVVQGSRITIKRGDVITIPLTNIGSLTGRTKLWFTVKPKGGDVADNASTIQITEADGLLYLNGAAGTASDGSLVVDDAALGNVTITLEAAATALLAKGDERYDIQALFADGPTTMTEGPFSVTADVTRATS